MVVAEVFKLDEAVRPTGLHGRDEFFDKFVVGFARNAFVAKAEVVRVLEIALRIRTDVDRHGKRAFRMNPGASRVEGELAAGNAHAVDAEVAKAQDALTVGDDDHVHFFLRAVRDEFRNAALVFDRHE